MLPNFLVIGAMKAGTTSLHHYLAAHPQIHMSSVKEPHFFVKGVVRSEGVVRGWEQGWPWYEALFAEAGDALAVGESSTSYTAYPARPGVPGRIAEALPDVRLIYLLRHPLERARSEYVHKCLVGRERRPAAAALLEDPVYLDKSRYMLQIDQYLAHFPRERLLMLLSEDLRSDHEGAMGQVWKFLGVESLAAAGPVTELNRTGDRVPVTDSRRRLSAQRVPGYERIARGSPAPLRVLYRAATRPRNDVRKVVVPDDVVEEMERRLRPDLDRLGALLPAALSRWGLRHGAGLDPR